MESSKKRRINSGKEFDHLFPPPSGVDKSVKQRADVEDTLKLVRRTVPETLWQTREIAKMLKGRTLEETCSNIWHFVYDHIQYKRDEDGVEQVRSPRRTWWERKSGVDCDCYTEFISSILLNLNIPHKARITKYPKKPPEIPRWQHIYPVVPRNGRLDEDLEDRDDYIVIDCVKDDYDDEQEFLEFKDYDMRLDYLDGIEDERQDTGWIEEPDYFQPDSVDASDLVSVYDDEELGNILKKVGSAVKTVASKASSAVKTVASKAGTAVKTVAQDIKKTAPVLAKKVADDVGKGIRVVNRFANPATVLLRNGFLLAMKVNLFNVAGRLRYAYLSDAQARQQGINVNTLQKVRTVKDRAETVYWQAGGKKENLKKAILQGKGNKDKKVPLSGLSGLDNVYMDMDEYRILHHGSDETQGLGEIASGAALTAASGAVAAIAAALSQIKGLFDKGGKEETAFQSETDNAGNASSLPANVSEDEDTLTDRTDLAPEQVEIPKPSFVPQTSAPAKNYVPPPPAPMLKPTPKPPAPKPPAPKPTPVPTQTPIQTITESKSYNETPASNYSASSDKSLLPGESSTGTSLPSSSGGYAESTAIQTSPGSEIQPAANGQKEKGFVQKTTAWIKQNPGKSLLITGAVVGGTYLLINSMSGNKPRYNGDGLSGLAKRKQKRKKTKNRKRKSKQRNRIQKLNLL